MMDIRGVFPVLTLIVAFMVNAIPAAAQDDPQAATPIADRIVPLPAECIVEPRTAESLIALATPQAEASPAGTPSDPEIPFGAFAGTPANAETAAEYTAFIRLFWACNNTGDMTQILPLLTDDEIRRGFLPEDLIFFAQPAAGTPEPLVADEHAAIFAILGIQELGDDRVGAYVVVDTPFDPLPVEVNYMIAIETREGWRLDQFVCFDAIGGYCA